MRNRIECKPGAGFDEALDAGYRVSAPRNPSKKLRDLCGRLGDEYHLATIDYGNVIHRVIGKGWDVEIFPKSSRSDTYFVVLWKGYGTEWVVTEENVRDDAVMCMAEMLLHIYVPSDVYPTRFHIGPRPGDPS